MTEESKPEDYPCHCGRLRACYTATEEEAKSWLEAAALEDWYWVETSCAVCQVCWDQRCDTADGSCG